VSRGRASRLLLSLCISQEPLNRFRRVARPWKGARCWFFVLCILKFETRTSAVMGPPPSSEKPRTTGWIGGILEPDGACFDKELDPSHPQILVESPLGFSFERELA
jgi:hypothetical protein